MSWTVAGDTMVQLVSGHTGIRRSTDGGRTWTDLTAYLPGSDIHASGLDPANPMRLWAHVAGDTVYSSDDGGRSWRRLGPDGLSMFGPILVDPATHDLIGADAAAGVVRSADGGRTWSASGPKDVYWVAIDPQDSKHLVVLGAGLNESRDSGRTWQLVGTLTQGIRAVAISPVDPGTWYGARIKNQDAEVLQSKDGGRSWTQVAPSG